MRLSEINASLEIGVDTVLSTSDHRYRARICARSRSGEYECYDIDPEKAVADYHRAMDRMQCRNPDMSPAQVSAVARAWLWRWVAPTETVDPLEEL